MGIYYGNNEQDPEFTIFKNYLELHELVKVSFAYIFDEKLKEEMDLEKSYKFAIVRKLDKNHMYLTHAFTLDNLKNFIHLESYPQIMNMDHRLVQDIMRNNYSSLLLIKKSNHKKSEKADVEFQKACQKLRGVIKCSIMLEENEMEKQILNILGVKQDELPIVRIVKPKNADDFDKFKPVTNKINEENVIKFAQDYSKNKIEHYLKSEAIPEYQDGNFIVTNKLKINFHFIFF